MDASEQYVRSVWSTVSYAAPDEDCDVAFVQVLARNLEEFDSKNPPEAWAAAAAFTREREEECRQLRRQIKWVKQFILSVKRDYPQGVIFMQESEPSLDEKLEATAERAREDVTGLMIVSRLESILAEKQAGMKQKEAL